MDPEDVAFESPYAAFRNNPIIFNDPDGNFPGGGNGNGNGNAGASGLGRGAHLPSYSIWWTYAVPGGAVTNGMRWSWSNVDQNTWIGKFGTTTLGYANVPMSLTQAAVNDPGDAALTYSPIGGMYTAIKLYSSRHAIYQNVSNVFSGMAKGNPEAWGNFTGFTGNTIAGFGSPEFITSKVSTFSSFSRMSSSFSGFMARTNTLIKNLAFQLRLSKIAPKQSPNGNFYSVAYEMNLNPGSYPNTSRYMHFKEANTALDGAMQSNPMLSELGIVVPRRKTGAINGKSPSGWVWHHDIAPGTMQLVPKIQHPNIPGGIFWNTLHPNGVGGYSLWGK